MPELKVVLRNIRTTMSNAAKNNTLPKWDNKDLTKANAHIAYLNALSAIDDRLPTFQLETVTTYKLKAINPE